MKRAYLLLIFLINSSSLNGGNTGSDQNAKSSTPKTDLRVKQATKEMNNYLNKIVYNAKTRSELEEHLKSYIDRDVPNPKLFPILNEIMADETNQNDHAFIASLTTAVNVILKNHMENKVKEMKL